MWHGFMVLFVLGSLAVFAVAMGRSNWENDEDWE